MTERDVRDKIEQAEHHLAGPPLNSSGTRRASAQVANDQVPTGAPQFSDDALAKLFTAKHGNDLRYVAAWGKWLIWSGCHWREDNTREVFSRARLIARSEAQRADKAGKQIASAKTVAAIERLAQADRVHAATTERFDADPWLLNTPGGTVDLRTGEIRPHKRSDYITKVTAVTPDPDAMSPIWDAFLTRILYGDLELQDYLQRVLGYSLTGSTREHAFFFCHGSGANGKGVLLGCASSIAGDYHKVAPMETFVSTRNEQHPTDVAGLRGARMVTATETEDGRRWDESRLKQMTGGDRISARLMRQDFFTFVPQFKIIIAGNHKPQVRSVDEAIRRRMHLIPFTVTIPPEERDDKLSDKLRDEWPAILAWMIKGAVDWNKDGLRPPDVVRRATDEYLEAEDAIGLWIEERCIQGNWLETLSSKLFADWKEWADESNEYIGSQKRLTQSLNSRGFESGHSRDGNILRGLAIQP